MKGFFSLKKSPLQDMLCNIIIMMLWQRRSLILMVNVMGFIKNGLKLDCSVLNLIIKTVYKMEPPDRGGAMGI